MIPYHIQCKPRELNFKRSKFYFDFYTTNLYETLPNILTAIQRTHEGNQKNFRYAAYSQRNIKPCLNFHLIDVKYKNVLSFVYNVQHCCLIYKLVSYTIILIILHLL